MPLPAFFIFFLPLNLCLPFLPYKAFTSLFFPSSTFTAFSLYSQASICKPFPHCPCLPLSFFPFTIISAFLFTHSKHLHFFFSFPLPSQPFPHTSKPLSATPFFIAPACFFHFSPSPQSLPSFLPTQSIYISFFPFLHLPILFSHFQASICNPFLIAHACLFHFPPRHNLCLLFYPLKAFTSLFFPSSTFTAFSSSLYLQTLSSLPLPASFIFSLHLNLFPFSPFKAFTSLFFPSSTFTAFSSHFQASICKPFPHCPCLFHFSPSPQSLPSFLPTQSIYISFFPSTFTAFSSHFQASICKPFPHCPCLFHFFPSPQSLPSFSTPQSIYISFFPFLHLPILFLTLPSLYLQTLSSLPLPASFIFSFPSISAFLFYSYKIHHFISLFFFTVYTTLTTLISASLAYLTASIE